MSLCGKCGSEKAGKRCRPCFAAYMRDYLARNPAQRAKANANRKRHYEANKDHHLAVCRKNYYEKHEHVKIRQRSYAAQHKAETDARRSRWQEENATHVREKSARRYRENRERILAENRRRAEHRGEQYNAARRERAARLSPSERLERSQKAYRADPEAFKVRARNRKARQLNAEGTHTGADVRRQYVLQDGKCFWCDAMLGNVFDADHLIPLAKGGSNGPENIVVACPHCNGSKGAKLPLDWAHTRHVAA
jgi:5-methylcytosine-specific restriction endonuclease McrA